MKKNLKLCLIPLLISFCAPLASCQSEPVIPVSSDVSSTPFSSSQPETVTLTTRYCDYQLKEDGTFIYVVYNEGVVFGADFTYPYGHELTEDDIEEIIETSIQRYPRTSNAYFGYDTYDFFSSTLDPIVGDLIPGVILTEDVTYYYHAC